MPRRPIRFFVLLITACALLGGCAVVEDAGDSVGQTLDQGLIGRGRIVQQDPTSDSFGPEYR